MKTNVLKVLVVFIILVMAAPISLMSRSKHNIRVLVAYYSKTGTTQKMAEQIALLTGGDLLRIEPAVPYPQNMDSLVKRAKTECQNNENIAIKCDDVRVEEYDVIFIGSPIWFSDWAAPAASFARDERLSGRRVIPFMTSGKPEQGEVLDLLYKKYCKTEPERGLCMVDKKVQLDKMTEVTRWLCDILSIKNCGNLTTMNVLACLREMKCRYPKITLCDVYKSFYQDYFGPGHLIESKSQATKYIKEELKIVDKASVGLQTKCNGFWVKKATGTEKCGALGRYVRVDLWKVKCGEININDYVKKLTQSVAENVDNDGWVKEWNFILSVIQNYKVPIDNYENDLKLINSRIASGKYGMHHSQVFNECYHPHYRIIKSNLLK